LRVLLHCCCGPCALLVADHFRSLHHDVTGWFFNPNLYPEEEHAQREVTLGEAAREAGLPLLPSAEPQPLQDFLLSLSRRGGRRCHACYELRLRETARKAAAEGFEAFSTTLLISPYQDLEAIAEIGAAAGEAAGVEFLFADLRGSYPASCDRARELDLYRQNYCGCLFSALERAERRSIRAIEKALGRAA
jgi:predicted adenine nucleotide alpha hydrolase (AANH) superfamily ATPase